MCKKECFFPIIVSTWVALNVLRSDLILIIYDNKYFTACLLALIGLNQKLRYILTEKQELRIIKQHLKGFLN